MPTSSFAVGSAVRRINMMEGPGNSSFSEPFPNPVSKADRVSGRPEIERQKDMKASIRYSGFYDVPRAFAVQHHGACLLFQRDFDDELDDSPDHYEVYPLPDVSGSRAERRWAYLPELAAKRLGQVPVRDVLFDAAKRREIDTAILDTLAAPREAVTV